MKIIVLSDSHGNVQAMLRAVAVTGPDMILHLGDNARDCGVLRKNFPQIPLRAVKGNCDPAANEPDVDEFVAEGKRIFMTHGHKYGVKSSLASIIHAGETRQADIILFGHTHEPCDLLYEGMHIINPGSLGRGSSTYGVLNVKDGTFEYMKMHSEI